MGLVNLNANHNEYVSAVPPSVNAALAELALVNLHLSTINGVLNVTMANNQMQAAQKEASHQKRQGWAEAIGEFAVAGAQVVAGGLTFTASTNFLSGLSSNAQIDEQIENASAYKTALNNRTGDAGLDDEELPLQNDPEETAAVEARLNEMIENRDFVNQKPDNKVSAAGTDSNMIDKLSDEQAATLSENIDQTIESLNSQKANNDMTLKIKEAKMKRMDGIGMIVQGVGQAGQAITRTIAGHETAEATVQRNLESVMGSQAQHFEQRDQSLLSESLKPFEQLVQMAQTQVVH
ncbi:MAG: hypothetical protein KDK64_01910 [Chlamydiia bacterium]|nr:hypothetical protein [Chlamydiia bacterium]